LIGLNIWPCWERNPVESARKPYVPTIGCKGPALARYKLESKGKNAKTKDDERPRAAHAAATFRPMDENHCV
jgi:hypothetical protein